MKLNKTIVDSLEFKGSNPKAKCIFWDDEVPGFGVRVWPSGKKTFLLAYRYAGRQRYLTLGAYGTLTPHQAREMAVVKRADVYRGFDPLAEKQKILRGETMADLCDAYLKRHADPRKKSAKKDADYIKRYIRPAWGTLKVKGLRHADVARLHQIGRAHV